MWIVYRIERRLRSLVSNLRNKVVMSASGIKYGKGFTSCGCILFRKYGGVMVIGDNVCINSHITADPIGGDQRTILVCGSNARLVLGNGVGVSNACIHAQDEIIIEDEACIGAGVKIYDTDFHSTIAEYRLGGNTNVPTKPVRIGKRSFIGGHSIILKGVTIGENAVIAAGSVVTKSVPANEIWGGNPATFIKKIDQ